jgi:hypothetical protein
MDLQEATALAEAELAEARELGYERLKEMAPYPAAESEQPRFLRRWVTREHQPPGHRRRREARGSSGALYQVVREVSWDAEYGGTIRIWAYVDDFGYETTREPLTLSELVEPPD